MKSSQPSPTQKHSHLAMIKTSPGGTVPLTRSVFLIYSAYKQENPIPCLPGVIRKPCWACSHTALPCCATTTLLWPHLRPPTPKWHSVLETPLLWDTISSDNQEQLWFWLWTPQDIWESHTRLLVILLSFAFILQFVQFHEKARL